MEVCQQAATALPGAELFCAGMLYYIRVTLSLGAHVCTHVFVVLPTGVCAPACMLCPVHMLGVAVA